MNFFRKKTSAYITLERPDFAAQTGKLWGDLSFALQGHREVRQVTMKLYDNGDLPLRVVSVIVTLGLKLRAESVDYELEASPKTIAMLRRLNLASAFTQLTEVNDGN